MPIIQTICRYNKQIIHTVLQKNNAWMMAAAAIIGFAGCARQPVSKTTGQTYNDPKWGGFYNPKYKGQETGPGLVLVEGGSFTMGSTEFDLQHNNDNTERTVTVNSFYMDEAEISNQQYKDYVYWLGRTFVSYPEVYQKALPDSLCWRRQLGFNEPFVEYYFRHPSYKDYPVVGVSWKQASEFAQWRTDRVNEYILDREGIVLFKIETDAVDDNNFNTRAYLANQFDFVSKNKKSPLKDYSKKKNKDQRRQKAIMEDGILLPEYRLPTESEWEYASQNNIGEVNFTNIDQKKIYGWTDYTVRIKDQKENDRGKIRLNAMVGKGDMGGIAGGLNDAGFVPTPVYSYWPNSYGLYNMEGNVAEWTMDVYRPLSLEDFDEFMPFRGNVFKTLVLDQYGAIVDKDSLGRLTYRDVTEAENVNRRNYKKADNMGFKDELNYNSGEMTYDYGVTSLINNKARVYKGASWSDRLYYASPGTRRFLEENLSQSNLGFRCAMVRIGAPTGNAKKKYNRLPSSGIDKKTKQRK